jgi:hypothetical protein
LQFLSFVARSIVTRFNEFCLAFLVAFSAQLALAWVLLALG